MSGSPFLFTSFLITSLFTSLILGLAGTSASAQDTSGGDDPLQALKERQDKILQVVKNAQPAVVSITSRSRQGSGSGVIINPEGLILTAGHVTSTTGDVLIIILPNGDEVPGEALGAHMSRDAGMARITTDRTDWPYVELGDPDEVTLGQWCVAIGHPGGFDKQRTAPIRAGKVLRKHKGFLVSDCTLAGGDSGGALFDLEGKLIGIHSSISVSLAQNMHVAMDAFEGEDRKRMEADETWGELSQAAVFNEDDAPQNPRSRQPNAAKRGRAVLGAVLERRSRNGVLIKRLPDSSPAKAGGAREGDVIIGFEGKEIATYPELTESVSEKSPGDKVSIKVRRGDEQIDLEIELGDRSRVR